MNRKLEHKERLGTEKIRKAFGVDLERLPFGMDMAFIKKIQRLVRQKPRLENKTALLLSDPQFKYHEKNILLFLNRKFRRCDCVSTRNPGYSARANLDNVRYIEASSLRSASYDRVISYGSLEFLCRTLGKVKAGKYVLILTARDAQALMARPGLYKDLEKIRERTVTFSLFTKDIPALAFPWPRLKIEASVRWPPTLDLFYRPPERPLFDYMFMGGGSRDYRFLLENRRLFKNKKVIVSHIDAHEHSGPLPEEYAYDAEYTARLRKEKNFICLDRLNESLYCKLLLYSRVLVCLFRLDVLYDSACVSDALWYGKPLITSPVMATAGLKDLVLFVRSPEEMKSAMKKLEDPVFLRSISKKAMRHARRENNIFDLLKRIP